MSDYIIDTNVWLAASEEGDFTGEAMDICRQFLESIKQTASAKIVMDLASFEEGDTPGNSVLDELKRNIVEGSYAHDLFYKHFLRDFRIELVELSYDHEGAVLPNGVQIMQKFEDGKVAPFEPNDRKWIALYMMHPLNPIYVARDSDWENAREDLIQHGVQVHQLITGRHIV